MLYLHLINCWWQCCHINSILLLINEVAVFEFFVDDCLGDLQELKQSCADLVGRDWKDGDKARAAEVLVAFISLFDV